MNKLIINRFLVTISFVLLSLALSHAEGKIALETPQRVILNLTETPATSMAVTWRTQIEVPEAEVLVAVATGWKEFTEKTQSISAKNTQFITDDNDTVYHHSAIMNNLTPNTTYVYKVGTKSAWSEWNQFRTASAEFEPFEFVFMGDPQNNLREHCSRIFREAYSAAPGAAFWLFSGDLISDPEDWQYRDFFYAGGFIFRTVPSIMAPGNHDRSYKYENGEIARNKKNKKVRLNTVAEEWKQHFTLPENGLSGFGESSYFVDYQGARFIIIDTNDRAKLAEQAVWVRELLANNPNRWTIVSFHHPFYSAGRDRDNDETRNAFQSIFDEFQVDLVLTGHDHTYARSYKLVNNKKVEWTEPGTVYVVSVSGPKMYSVNSQYNHFMAKTGGNVQLYQVVFINEDKLEYTSYTVDGNIYDYFVLTK